MNILQYLTHRDSRLKRNRTFIFTIVLTVGVLFFADSFALPQGGSVDGGSAVISSPTPDTMQINQETNKAVINWQSFNVAPNEQVHFQQPDSSSIALNRIDPRQGASEIYGKLSANGQVWLVNSAGIYFGPSAYVDVAGIFATTANITDKDFMAGNYHFVQSPDWNGAVINDGIIKTAQAGLVALVGSGVVNNGYIEANLGTVVLAAGSEFTVHFSGNNLIEFAVDKEVLQPARDRHGNLLKNGVSNSGVITANGGKILMTARVAGKILDNAINMSGVAQANSVGMKNGVIVFSAGKKGRINVTGHVIASGKQSGEMGGKVHITGSQIKIARGTLIDVSGDVGGGEVLIGGDYQGKNNAVQNAKNTFVDKDVSIIADALMNGNGGKVIVWADNSTKFYGTISARGGAQGGNGGFVETSGKKYLDANRSTIDLRAPMGMIGTWLLDPTNIYIALNQASATLAGMSGSDNTADIGSSPFQATGSVSDSLLTTSTLATALAAANVVVTTTNAAGTGLGNIIVVDPISWSSASTLTLTAANTISINAGITTGTAASALILNATGNVTQTAAIGGSGGLTKQGAGTLTLSQNNTYTGTTTITTGIVNVQHNSGLGTIAGATTVASGAAIEINGSGLVIAEPISALIGTGVNSGGALRNLANNNEWSGGIIMTTAAGATIASDAGTLTLSGGITGATRPLTISGAGNILINSVIGTTTGTLTKIGTGLLTLTAVNTYSGATSVNAGQLTLSGNGTATSTAFTVASNSKLTLDNSGTNNADRIANALTLAGTNSEFAIIGNNAANTTESVGTLTLTSGYSIVTVTPNASFNTQLTFASFSRSAGAEILFRGINLGLNTVASQTANNSNIVFTAAPTLIGGGGNSGTTTVSILAGAIGDGGATGNTGTGTDFVTYNPPTGSVNGLRPLLASEYTSTPAANVNLKLTANRTADDTFSINSLLLSGGITYNFDNTAGANTLTLGSAALSGNILSIGGTNVIQTTTAPSGGLAFGTAEAKIFAVSDLTFGSNVPIAGTGSLTKNGVGTLLENRSVTISGGIRVNAGTLKLGIANAFSTAQAFTVLSPATWNLNGFSNSITTLTLNAGATTGATIATGGAGTLTLGGNVTLNVNGSGAVGATISGNLALGGTTRTFTVNDGTATNDLTISAVISDGTAGITKAGTGTLSLSGINTYVGTTTVSAGTLEAANASALGTTAGDTSVSNNATLQINNVSIGAENITFNNGATLSGTGTASLSGNITLAGSAVNRTISTVLGTDTLTLNGTIDGLAAALTISGSGTVKLQNTVGAVTPLTSITSNTGSTLAVNGGSIRTSGSQTYNGAVTMTTASAIFEVTAALSDILMPNLLNNITQAINYAVSGLGSIRDITLANNAATAVVPTLPSGLRNLSLTFNNAGITLPALTLTGTLTAFSLGNNMTQSGALNIAGQTTLGSGSFNTTLTNASNDFGTLTVNGGVNVSVRDANAINLGGATAAVSGNYSVISGGAITDNARISANTLTTTSVGGTTLDFANHTISNFNATNTTSGTITLINTIPISLTGISQSGGGTTVSITNTGTVSIPNGVTIGSGTTLSITADDLNLNSTGAISSGTTTSITQRLAGGSIGLGNTAGTMTISGSELQRITATGLTLTNSSDGAITVDGITAANSANVSGTITLTATTGTLGTLSFLNNASSFRTLTTSSDAGTTIGANLATTVGALSLTVTGGALSVSNGATASSNTTIAVTANDLNLNTTGALTSTTTTSVTSNSGSIGLGNTAGTMTISGSELQRMTATGLTLTNASDAAINVDGITAANSANISGAITLTATTGTLGTLSFINNASSFRTLTTSSDAGTTVGTNLATTVGALSFTVNTGALSVSDGATALSNTTLAVTANDLNLNTTGALTSTTTMTVAENIASASIGLGNTAGTMSISGSELQRMTATGLTITNASDGAINVDGITAANTASVSGTITLNATTGTLGTLSFINNASSFRTLTANSDAGTTVGTNLSTAVGALSFTVNSGTLSVANGATALSNITLAVTANDLNLNTTGALTSTTTMSVTPNSGSIGLGNTAGTMTISGSELQRMTATGLTLTNASDNAINVDGITAANSANISGAITLNATTGTLGTLSFINNASSFRTLTAISDASTTVGANLAATVSGLSLTVNSGALSISNGATASSTTTLAITANDLNLNTTGALNSSTSTTITNNIATSDIGLGNAVGSMTISGAELQRITGATLSIVAALNGNIVVNGVTAANTANVSGAISLTATNGTLGAVSFQTASSTFTNGLTVSSDNAVSVADGLTLATSNSALSITASDLNLNTTGALNSGLGDTTIAANTGTFGVGNAAGTMTLTKSELQRITANNLTLTNSSNSSINVENVQVADLTNILGTVLLNAVTGTTGSITFQTAASTFKSLSVTADGIINVNVPLSTTVGNLPFISNAASINLNANVTSVGNMTFSALDSGIILGAPVILTGNGVTFNHFLNGAFDLTINAGTGDLTFAGNVGSISRLGTLTINNVNNVTNTLQLNVSSYNQLAGNLTAFGSTGLNATGSAVVNANNVTGAVNVAALSLNTVDANLTGFVNGLSGQAAVNIITLLNTISAGTHFFDGIDMFVPPVIPPTPTIPRSEVPQVMSYYLYVLPNELFQDGYLVSNDLSVDCDGKETDFMSFLSKGCN